jgi:hypothetical protein
MTLLYLSAVRRSARQLCGLIGHPTDAPFRLYSCLIAAAAGVGEAHDAWAALTGSIP